MNKDSINEMEQIQQGLEQFLEKEVQGYKDKQPTDTAETFEDFEEIEEIEEDTAFANTPKAEESWEDDDWDEDDYDWDEEEDEDEEEYIPKKKSPKPVARSGEGKVPVKKKKKRRKSRLKRFLITLLVIAAILVGILYFLVGLVYAKVEYREIPSVSSASMKEDGVVNILLIGNDSRSQDEAGRSDAMILLSISKKTKTIHMTSLLRDMYVEIPGRDGNRLNAAYSFGGAELLMETVRQNLGVDVHRYVQVNFRAFANLVDAVGGVDLELTNDEVIYVNGYLVEYNILEGRNEGEDYLDASLSGMIHLNGPQALAYTRNRYLGTDFGRTERQRKVLGQVFKKIPGAIVKSPRELVNGLLPNLVTNLTQKEFFQLSLMAGKLITYDMVQSSIPMEGTFKNSSIRGMDVLEVDFEANKRYIRTEIYGDK